MARLGRAQVEGRVRPLSVVVMDIDAKDVFELATPDDQQPVEALAADGADPALHVRVRIRRLHRRPDDRESQPPSMRRSAASSELPETFNQNRSVEAARRFCSTTVSLTPSLPSYTRSTPR